MKMEIGVKLKWKFKPILAVIFLAIFLFPNFVSAKILTRGQNPSWISKNKIIFTKKYKRALNLFLFNIKTKKIKHLIRDADHDYVNASGNIFCQKGKEIVFSSDRRGNDEIWTFSLINSKLKRLTYNKARDLEPVWSPNCRFIAFQSDRDGNWEIYKLRLKDKRIFRLTSYPSRDQQPDWSKTNKIIFQSNHTGNWDIWKMTISGEKLKNLTNSPKEETDVVWSQNGKYFAYSGDGIKSEEIFVRRAKRQDKTYQLTNNEFYDGAPSFSPNGKQIVFESKILGQLYLRIKQIKLSP